MTTNVGQIAYDVSLDTGKLIQGQRDAERKLESVAKAGDKLQAKFTAVAAGVSAALSSIAVGALVTKLVSAQRQFDVMFSSLKTVTGGADQASAAWSRLVAFAAKTPYSLAQSVEAFTKLKALGLDPSERSMTSFGNTASAMGKDIMQMAEAVADASTGEFERLKEFGIKASKEGDKVSLTFQGVTTTIGNSAAEITEYLTKIGEVNFAGAMEDRAKTLDGSISNLEDRFASLYLTVSQSGIGDAIKAAVDKASEALEELAASVKDGKLTDYFATLKALTPAVELAVVSLAGALTSRLVAAMIATVAQAYATARAVGAASLATTTFTSIISALGGPVGIAVTALVLLVSNWDKLGFSAKSAADISERAADRIAKAQKKTARGGKADLEAQIKEAEDSIKKLNEARRREKVGYTGPASADVIAGIDDKISAYKDVISKARGAILDIEHAGELAVRSSVFGKLRGETDEQTRAREAKESAERAKREEAARKSSKAGKSGAAPFDQDAYLSDLRKAQASEISVINETEAEKLRIAKKNLDGKKISEAAYAEAVTMIVQAAEQDRQSLMAKTQASIDQDRQEDMSKTQKAWELMKQGWKAVSDYVQSLNKAVDPIAALETEYQEKLALVTQYEQMIAAAGVDATRQGQIARAQIESAYEAQRLALAEQSFASQSEAHAFLMNSINALGNSASSAIMGLIEHTMTAADVMRSLGRTILQEAVNSVVQFGLAQVKNAILGETIAASKGAAYAASVSAQVTGMSALAAQNAFAATAAIPIVGPVLAPAAAVAAATAAAAIGAPAIASAPVAGARRYGGPTSGGSLYRVNESGRPEMFTASNGSQFMLSSSNGKVTAADKVGGAGGWTFIVQNNAPSAAVSQPSVDNTAKTITWAVAEVSNQIRENSGPVWNALRSSTNVQGRL